MNTNDPKSWDKEMSVAQIFGQMVAGSIFTAIALGVPIVFISSKSGSHNSSGWSEISSQFQDECATEFSLVNRDT